MAPDSVKSSRIPRYKRPLDLFVLMAAHIALAPIWIALWVTIPTAIALEGGRPIFFVQHRSGRGGREFPIRKFRTMIPNADKVGPAWTTESDPRVTRVGRFLRRTGLDELPEILSIWKGDMSLVGPRALPVEEQRHLEQQIPNFGDRLNAVPGLTGLAQLRNPEDDPVEKLRYDLEYIEQASLLLDVRLLVASTLNTLFLRWDKRSGKSSQ